MELRESGAEIMFSVSEYLVDSVSFIDLGELGAGEWNGKDGLGFEYFLGIECRGGQSVVGWEEFWFLGGGGGDFQAICGCPES